MSSTAPEGPISLAPRNDNTAVLAFVALVALFITALVTAQVTASKLLAFELPVALPVTGAELVLPGAAIAYSLTFIASDCLTELYGRRTATIVVNVGFGMNFVLLALVWSTIVAPAAATSVDPAAFEDVLAASTNIVLASLLAFLVSQNFDVYAFDRLRRRTDGAHLWLRNLASTSASQAIDTVLFVTLGFAIVPSLIGVGPVLQGDELAALIIGQYLLKLVIALLDTPIVYAIVHLVRSRTADGR